MRIGGPAPPFYMEPLPRAQEEADELILSMSTSWLFDDWLTPYEPLPGVDAGLDAAARGADAPALGSQGSRPSSGDLHAGPAAPPADARPWRCLPEHVDSHEPCSCRPPPSVIDEALWELIGEEARKLVPPAVPGLAIMLVPKFGFCARWSDRVTWPWFLVEWFCQ